MLCYAQYDNSREMGMGLHSNGSHSGSTSSMGDTECLMKVEMGDVSAVVSRATQTNLGIHISSINIDLPGGGGGVQRVKRFDQYLIHSFVAAS